MFQGITKNQIKTNEHSRAGACPTFFRALCQTARRGGKRGYFLAAHELMRSVPELCPDGMGVEDWNHQLASLDKLLDSTDTDEEIWAWFKTNLPRCTSLVPVRRRSSFVSGVRVLVETQGFDH